MKVGITVFTPTYNRGSFLRRLFRSLELQTNQNFEWLIVDDGSTDESARVVQSVNDTRIRLIRQSNAGVSAARNFSE